MNNLTRRGIIRRTGAALAGLAAPLPETPPPPEGSKWERPPRQQGNGLNVVLLVSDTFRADNLAVYGSRWVQAPNLDRLASQSVIFEDAYPEGLPTIPVRRQLVTGRRVAPMRYYPQHEPVQLPGWHDLFHEDVTLSEVLREAGYLTALIADVPHLQRPGRSFHRGFGYYEWVRGQEIDSYAQAPRRFPDYSDLYPAEYLDRADPSRQFAAGRDSGLRAFLNQYLANRRRWLAEGGSLVEITSRKAIRWLRENHAEAPFFLHVEAFDPHEPWDPPPDFLNKYLKKPSEHRWPEPPYADLKIPPEGLERLRANYAGEASNVDYWFGQILDAIAELGLAKNTVVVFLSDHGALLGEQGQFVKGPERLRTQVAHIPLLIRTPAGDFAGHKVPGFVQIPDVGPTILGRLGLKPPARATGEDLWPYVSGERRNPRDHVVITYAWIASLRTREWNYSAVWNREKYSGRYEPQLYHLARDPEELRSVADARPAVLQELHAKIEAYMSSGRPLTRGSFHAAEA